MACGVLAKYSITLMLHAITTSVIIKSSVLTYAIYSVPISSVLGRVEKSWRCFTDTRPLLGSHFSLLHCYITVQPTVSFTSGDDRKRKQGSTLHAK